MNLEALKEKLQQHDIPERWYSLDDGLKPDALIIYKNYSLWECFYLDEKGNRNLESVCRNEEDAYDWLWDKLQVSLRYRRKN